MPTRTESEKEHPEPMCIEWRHPGISFSTAYPYKAIIKRDSYAR